MAERSVVSVSGLLEAPCVFCGYNGPGYWQRLTHDKNCPWYPQGGFNERREVLPKFLRFMYLHWVATEMGDDRGAGLRETDDGK